MEFDIEAYKQQSAKKRQVIRRFKDKINESSDSNMSILSSSSKKELGTKDKIEDFFKTQRRIGSIINDSPRSFLKQSRISEEVRRNSAKNKSRFENILDTYFSGIQLAGGEFVIDSKRPLDNTQNKMPLNTPYKQRTYSTRIGKSPLIAFKEQYYNQKGGAEDRKEPSSPFQSERSFLNKSRTMNSGVKFDINKRQDSGTKYPLQYRNVLQKLTYPDIQNFQKKIDAMTDREIANLPTK